MKKLLSLTPSLNSSAWRTSVASEVTVFPGPAIQRGGSALRAERNKVWQERRYADIRTNSDMLGAAAVVPSEADVLAINGLLRTGGG